MTNVMKLALDLTLHGEEMIRNLGFNPPKAEEPAESMGSS